MLYIFLHDPAFCLRILFEDELIDVPQVSKQLDSAALVFCSRLDKPHVLLTVLHGYTFLVRTTA